MVTEFGLHHKSSVDLIILLGSVAKSGWMFVAGASSPHHVRVRFKSITEATLAQIKW